MKKTILLILTLFTFIFFLISKPVQAVPPAYNLSVAPPTAYVHVKPGEILTHNIELRNQGLHTLAVEMTISEFSTDGRTGKPIIGKESIFNQALKNTPGFDKPFIIKPRENRTVNLKLDISKVAEEKEYPLTILFKAKKIQATPQDQAGITQVSGIVGSNLIIFISEDDYNKGKLIAHEIEAPKLIDSFANISFTTLAKNIGNNATQITGKATITHLLTNETKEFIFYPDMVLADNSRQVRGVSKSDAVYDENNLLDIEKMGGLKNKFSYKAPFLFGPYRLTINLDGKDTHFNIYAFPFSIIGAIFAGLLVYFLYQHLNKRYSTD